MLKTKNALPKKNRTNRTNPSCIGLVWFGWLFKSYPNQTVLRIYIDYY